MLPWQEIALPLGRQNVTVGQTVNQAGILQDSYTYEFIIGFEGVIGTAAATAAIEGLSSIANKVTIGGPLAGYQPLTPINGLSGPMLVEAAQFIRRNVSYSFGSLGSTGKFGVYIPCTFLQPRLGSPLSLMSVLPTIAMGAVNFNVQIASQAQLDTNATPTLAFSSLSMYVQQNEYKSSTIPAMAKLVPASQVTPGSWQFIPSTLNYNSFSNVTATQQQQIFFPNGTYTLFLIRSFSTTSGGVATARQSDTVAGGPLDLSITSQGLTLQDVNQNPKISSTYYLLRKDNLDNVFDSLVTGNACFQFNNHIQRIFQTAPGPNQIPLLLATTTTGTTNPRLDFVYQQIFDSQNWLNLV